MPFMRESWSGLVVMGGDTCYEGRGFESQHRQLDGYLKTLYASTNGRNTYTFASDKLLCFNGAKMSIQTTSVLAKPAYSIGLTT